MRKTKGGNNQRKSPRQNIEITKRYIYRIFVATVVGSYLDLNAVRQKLFAFGDI
jgi:hypothetical protein